ncbi:hypothetical protein TNCV_2212491 [Trichonephila clavipes]|nr:hypothetical protein TNCV_2212491 [Trichonephila clavipes]
MADLLPRNRVLPNTTSQRGDTSQVLSSMRSPSSALVAPFNRLIYSQILTRWKQSSPVRFRASSRSPGRTPTSGKEQEIRLIAYTGVNQHNIYKLLGQIEKTLTMRNHVAVHGQK